MTKMSRTQHFTPSENSVFKTVFKIRLKFGGDASLIFRSMRSEPYPRFCLLPGDSFWPYLPILSWKN